MGYLPLIENLRKEYPVLNNLHGNIKTLGGAEKALGVDSLSQVLKKAKFLRCLGKRGAFRYIQKTNSVSKNIQNIEGWQVPHILDTVVQTVWVDLGR